MSYLFTPMSQRLPPKDVPQSSKTSLLQWITETEQRLLRCNTTSLRNKFKTSSFRFLDRPVGSSLAEAFTSVDPLHLDPESPNNALALSHETWLKDREHLASKYIAQYANDDKLASLLNSLPSYIRKDLSHFDNFKRMEWERQKMLIMEVNPINPGKVKRTGSHPADTDL